MEELWMDHQIADIIRWNDEWSDTDQIISFMYENGIMKKDSPFEGSRWGINFRAVVDVPVEDRTVAIHEGGHAIVRMVHGAKFDLIEFGGRLAEAYIQPIDLQQMGYKASNKYRKWTIANEMSMAGGPVAASKLLFNNATTWTVGASNDIILLSTIEMTHNHDYVKKLVDTAIDIVETRWMIVEALADELMKIKKLRYPQCVKIANRVCPNGWMVSEEDRV